MIIPSGKTQNVKLMSGVFAVSSPSSRKTTVIYGIVELILKLLSLVSLYAKFVVLVILIL